MSLVYYSRHACDIGYPDGQIPTRSAAKKRAAEILTSNYPSYEYI